MDRSTPGWLRLVGAALLTNPAAVLGTIAPAIIIGLTLETHLQLATAGRLVAIQFTAMTIGILLLPLMLGHVTDRVLAGAAIGAALLGQLAWLSGSFSTMAVGQTVLGFAEGTLFGLAIATLARTPNPDRAFGISVFLNQALSALLLALATVAHRLFPTFGIVGLLSAFLLVIGLFVPAMSNQIGDRRTRRGFEAKGVAAMVPPLASILLFAAAFGTAWPLVASIGRAHGMAEAEIGRILAVAGFVGISGAVAAILLAERIGRAIPLIGGSVCFAIALSGALGAHVPIAAPAILFFWSFLAPYFLGAAAAADAQGRLAVLAGAMIPLGIAAGQMLATTVLNPHAPERLGISAAAIMILAIIFVLFTLRPMQGHPAKHHLLTEGRSLQTVSIGAQLDAFEILANAGLSSLSSHFSAASSEVNTSTTAE